MQGSKCFVVLSALILISLSACSGEKGLRKADCYDCTTQTQSWKKFAWPELEGTWRGSLETVVDEVSAKTKQHKDRSVTIRFLNGEKFLEAHNLKSCGNFPKNSIVVNGTLWLENEKEVPEKTYEVFGQANGDEVNYGRAVLSKINGENVCTFEKFGGSVAMNRLALPSVHFTERLTPNGRILASGTTSEFQLNFEFLNFNAEKTVAQNFTKDSRKPTALDAQDNPPLMFRVFKIINSVKGAYDDGRWVSTQEHIYRLWRIAR